MELPPNAIEAILERWPVAALSTSGDRGPHAVPIVFARAAGALWSPIDGKPKRGYSSERTAKQEAARFGMTYYRCDFCDRFHLTKADEAGGRRK